MVEAFRIFVGYDTREREAFEVCRRSLLKHSSIPLTITPLEERRLRHAGIYSRPWFYDEGYLDA